MSAVAERLPATARAADPADRGRDWPHTSRLMPWAVAAFLVMLWLVPFDAAQLPVNLPVDSKIDRFAIVGLAGLWLMLLLCAARRWRPVRRPALFGVALFIWLTVIVLSLMINAPALSRTGELAGALRSLSVTLSLFALYFIVVTTLRPGEVRPMLDFMTVLACITAVGVIVQFRTQTNYFYEFVGAIPGLEVRPPPASNSAGVRASITGPTGHGLAVCTMLSCIIPYAAVSAFDKVGRARWLYLAAVLLCFTGAAATQRKSAVIVAIAALLVIAALRPRESFRALPLVAILVVLLQVATPGSISGLRYQFQNATTSNSTTGRTEDYEATLPDIKNQPALGRGYSAYNPLVHRFIDNEYLVIAITTGLVGLLVFTGLYVAAAVPALRLARGTDARAGPAAGLLAGIVGIAVAGFLFDSLSFRQVPYLLFLSAAFIVVLDGRGAGDDRPSDGAVRA